MTRDEKVSASAQEHDVDDRQDNPSGEVSKKQRERRNWRAPLTLEHFVRIFLGTESLADEDSEVTLADGTNVVTRAPLEPTWIEHEDRSDVYEDFGEGETLDEDSFAIVIESSSSEVSAVEEVLEEDSEEELPLTPPAKPEKKAKSDPLPFMSKRPRSGQIRVAVVELASEDSKPKNVATEQGAVSAAPEPTIEQEGARFDASEVLALSQTTQEEPEVVTAEDVEEELVAEEVEALEDDEAEEALSEVEEVEQLAAEFVEDAGEQLEEFVEPTWLSEESEGAPAEPADPPAERSSGGWIGAMRRGEGAKARLDQEDAEEAQEGARKPRKTERLLDAMAFFGPFGPKVLPAPQDQVNPEDNFTLDGVDTTTTIGQLLDGFGTSEDDFLANSRIPGLRRPTPSADPAEPIEPEVAQEEDPIVDEPELVEAEEGSMPEGVIEDDIEADKVAVEEEADEAEEVAELEENEPAGDVEPEALAVLEADDPAEATAQAEDELEQASEPLPEAEAATAEVDVDVDEEPEAVTEEFEATEEPEGDDQEIEGELEREQVDEIAGEENSEQEVVVVKDNLDEDVEEEAEEEPEAYSDGVIELEAEADAPEEQERFDALDSDEEDEQGDFEAEEGDLFELSAPEADVASAIDGEVEEDEVADEPEAKPSDALAQDEHVLEEPPAAVFEFERGSTDVDVKIVQVMSNIEESTAESISEVEEAERDIDADAEVDVSIETMNEGEAAPEPEVVVEEELVEEDGAEVTADLQDAEEADVIAEAEARQDEAEQEELAGDESEEDALVESYDARLANEESDVAGEMTADVTDELDEVSEPLAAIADANDRESESGEEDAEPEDVIGGSGSEPNFAMLRGANDHELFDGNASSEDLEEASAQEVAEFEEDGAEEIAAFEGEGGVTEITEPETPASKQEADPDVSFEVAEEDASEALESELEAQVAADLQQEESFESDASADVSQEEDVVASEIAKDEVSDVEEEEDLLEPEHDALAEDSGAEVVAEQELEVAPAEAVEEELVEEEPEVFTAEVEEAEEEAVNDTEDELEVEAEVVAEDEGALIGDEVEEDVVAEVASSNEEEGQPADAHDVVAAEIASEVSEAIEEEAEEEAIEEEAKEHPEFEDQEPAEVPGIAAIAEVDTGASRREGVISEQIPSATTDIWSPGATEESELSEELGGEKSVGELASFFDDDEPAAEQVEEEPDAESKPKRASENSYEKLALDWVNQLGGISSFGKASEPSEPGVVERQPSEVSFVLEEFFPEGDSQPQAANEDAVKSEDAEGVQPEKPTLDVKNAWSDILKPKNPLVAATRVREGSREESEAREDEAAAVTFDKKEALLPTLGRIKPKKMLFVSEGQELKAANAASERPFDRQPEADASSEEDMDEKNIPRAQVFRSARGRKSEPSKDEKEKPRSLSFDALGASFGGGLSEDSDVLEIVKMAKNREKIHGVRGGGFGRNEDITTIGVAAIMDEEGEAVARDFDEIKREQEKQEERVEEKAFEEKPESVPRAKVLSPATRRKLPATRRKPSESPSRRSRSRASSSSVARSREARELKPASRQKVSRAPSPDVMLTRNIDQLNRREHLETVRMPTLSTFGQEMREQVNSEDEILSLYRDFVILMHRYQLMERPIDFHVFAARVSKQRNLAREKYGSKKLVMEVQVSAGKPFISIRPG